MIIEFGALAQKLSEQIPGLPKRFDVDAKAIDRLYLCNILTESETDKARDRLLKQIVKYRKGKKS